jgi:hypothetical protein
MVVELCGGLAWEMLSNQATRKYKRKLLVQPSSCRFSLLSSLHTIKRIITAYSSTLSTCSATAVIAGITPDSNLLHLRSFPFKTTNGQHDVMPSLESMKCVNCWPSMHRVHH